MAPLCVGTNSSISLSRQNLRVPKIATPKHGQPRFVFEQTKSDIRTY